MMRTIFQYYLLVVSIILVQSNVFTEDEDSLTSECSKCRELVERGIDYYGNDIRSIQKVSSWSQCKDHCTDEPECKYWSHDSTLSQCLLKTSDRGRKEVSQTHTSGNRECGEVIVAATADFTQSNLCGFKALSLKGYRLQDGDYIFSWQRGSRRMVLTDNEGHVKKWGAVQYGVMSWRDPSTWVTHDNRQYTVNNFKLLNHSSVCPKCTEFIDAGAGYPLNLVESVEGISSYTECKDLCTRHIGCKVWTLLSLEQTCRLKSEKGSVWRTKHRISGTQACYGFISETSDDNNFSSRIL